MPAPSQSRAAAATRVKRWTRERFALDPAAVILVTELEVHAQAEPGNGA